jgi:hypothetical protein
MQKIRAFKFVARLVVASGTTTVTNSIIRNNVAPANLPQQISVGVAALVIGSMASEATRAHTDRQIDGLVEAWNSARSEDKDETPTETVTDES